MSVTNALVAISQAQNTSAADHATRLLATVANWIRRCYAIHKHQRTLYALPDDMLKDIGISRSMIDGIVAERLDEAGRPKGV